MTHPTVLETVKARHDQGANARVMVEELLEALAVCTVGWGCDELEVAQIYIREVERRRRR